MEGKFRFASRRRERLARRALAVELWQELEQHLRHAGCEPERIRLLRRRAFVPEPDRIRASH